jgi:hypothetical protein
MTNEEVMQLMTDMGLHEGGIENWVMDNAWVLVVNKAIEKEREACASLQIEVVVPTKDYSSMTPLDCYEAALMDQAMAFRAAIRARGDALTRLNKAAEDNGEEL